MLGKHAFGLIFQGKSHAQQHCGFSVVDSSQQFRRRSARTAHCRYHHIGVDQESHLKNDIISWAISFNEPGMNKDYGYLPPPFTSMLIARNSI